MFLLLSALQKLMPGGNRANVEEESKEADNQSVASSFSRRQAEDTISRDGTASQYSLRSIEVESIGYNSDKEDDDYIHIYNSEYTVGAESCEEIDRESSRGFRWSSSKQSLTSLLETLSEEVQEEPISEAERKESVLNEICSRNEGNWDDYEVIEDPSNLKTNEFGNICSTFSAGKSRYEQDGVKNINSVDRGRHQADESEDSLTTKAECPRQKEGKRLNKTSLHAFGFTDQKTDVDVLSGETPTVMYKSDTEQNNHSSCENTVYIKMAPEARRKNKALKSAATEKSRMQVAERSSFDFHNIREEQQGILTNNDNKLKQCSSVETPTTSGTIKTNAIEIVEEEVFATKVIEDESGFDENHIWLRLESGILDNRENKITESANDSTSKNSIAKEDSIVQRVLGEVENIAKIVDICSLEENETGQGDFCDDKANEIPDKEQSITFTECNSVTNHDVVMKKNCQKDKVYNKIGHLEKETLENKTDFHELIERNDKENEGTVICKDICRRGNDIIEEDIVILKTIEKNRCVDKDISNLYENLSGEQGNVIEKNMMCDFETSGFGERAEENDSADKAIRKGPSDEKENVLALNTSKEESCEERVSCGDGKKASSSKDETVNHEKSAKRGKEESAYNCLKLNVCQEEEMPNQRQSKEDVMQKGVLGGDRTTSDSRKAEQIVAEPSERKAYAQLSTRDSFEKLENISAEDQPTPTTFGKLSVCDNAGKVGEGKGIVAMEAVFQEFGEINHTRRKSLDQIHIDGMTVEDYLQKNAKYIEKQEVIDLDKTGVIRSSLVTIRSGSDDALTNINKHVESLDQLVTTDQGLQLKSKINKSQASVSSDTAVAVHSYRAGTNSAVVSKNVRGNVKQEILIEEHHKKEAVPIVENGKVQENVKQNELVKEHLPKENESNSGCLYKQGHARQDVPGEEHLQDKIESSSEGGNVQGNADQDVPVELYLQKETESHTAGGNVEVKAGQDVPAKVYLQNENVANYDGVKVQGIAKQDVTVEEYLQKKTESSYKGGNVQGNAKEDVTVEEYLQMETESSYKGGNVQGNAKEDVTVEEYLQMETESSYKDGNVKEEADQDVPVKVYLKKETESSSEIGNVKEKAEQDVTVEEYLQKEKGSIAEGGKVEGNNEHDVPMELYLQKETESSSEGGSEEENAEHDMPIEAYLQRETESNNDGGNVEAKAEQDVPVNVYLQEGNISNYDDVTVQGNTEQDVTVEEYLQKETGSSSEGGNVQKNAEQDVRVEDYLQKETESSSEGVSVQGNAEQDVTVEEYLLKETKLSSEGVNVQGVAEENMTVEEYLQKETESGCEGGNFEEKAGQDVPVKVYLQIGNVSNHEDVNLEGNVEQDVPVEVYLEKETESNTEDRNLQGNAKHNVTVEEYLQKETESSSEGVNVQGSADQDVTLEEYLQKETESSSEGGNLQENAEEDVTVEEYLQKETESCLKGVNVQGHAEEDVTVEGYFQKETESSSEDVNVQGHAEEDVTVEEYLQKETESSSDGVNVQGNADQDATVEEYLLKETKLSSEGVNVQGFAEQNMTVEEYLQQETESGCEGGNLEEKAGQDAPVKVYLQNGNVSNHEGDNLEGNVEQDVPVEVYLEKETESNTEDRNLQGNAKQDVTVEEFLQQETESSSEGGNLQENAEEDMTVEEYLQKETESSLKGVNVLGHAVEDVTVEEYFQKEKESSSESVNVQGNADEDVKVEEYLQEETESGSEGVNVQGNAEQDVTVERYLHKETESNTEGVNVQRNADQDVPVELYLQKETGSNTEGVNVQRNAEQDTLVKGYFKKNNESSSEGGNVQGNAEQDMIVEEYLLKEKESGSAGGDEEEKAEQDVPVKVCFQKETESIAESVNVGEKAEQDVPVEDYLQKENESNNDSVNVQENAKPDVPVEANLQRENESNYEGVHVEGNADQDIPVEGFLQKETESYNVASNAKDQDVICDASSKIPINANIKVEEASTSNLFIEENTDGKEIKTDDSSKEQKRRSFFDIGRDFFASIFGTQSNKDDEKELQNKENCEAKENIEIEARLKEHGNGEKEDLEDLCDDASKRINEGRTENDHKNNEKSAGSNVDMQQEKPLEDETVASKLAIDYGNDSVLSNSEDVFNNEAEIDKKWDSRKATSSAACSSYSVNDDLKLELKEDIKRDESFERAKDSEEVEEQVEMLSKIEGRGISLERNINQLEAIAEKPILPNLYCSEEAAQEFDNKNLSHEKCDSIEENVVCVNLKNCSVDQDQREGQETAIVPTMLEENRNLQFQPINSTPADLPNRKDLISNHDKSHVVLKEIEKQEPGLTSDTENRKGASEFMKTQRQIEFENDEKLFKRLIRDFASCNVDSTCSSFARGQSIPVTEVQNAPNTESSIMRLIEGIEVLERFPEIQERALLNKKCTLGTGDNEDEKVLVEQDFTEYKKDTDNDQLDPHLKTKFENDCSSFLTKDEGIVTENNELTKVKSVEEGATVLEAKFYDATSLEFNQSEKFLHHAARTNDTMAYTDYNKENCPVFENSLLDETVLFDHNGKCLDDERVNYDDNNAVIMKQPTFNVLEEDFKDCNVSSRPSLDLKGLNLAVSSIRNNRLCPNANERDEIYASDDSYSEACDVNSEESININIKQECIDRPVETLNVFVIDSNTRQQVTSEQQLILLKRLKDCLSEEIQAKFVTYLETHDTKNSEKGVKQCRERRVVEEKNELSSLYHDLTPRSHLKREWEIIQKVICKVFITATEESSAASLKSQPTNSTATATDEKETPMQTIENETQQIDYRQKEEAKAKRFYIRQKAFDKYSFQVSTDEPAIQEQQINKGSRMNRTDSEKLDDQRLSAADAKEKTKILTNEISTDDPEVGADIKVIFSANDQSVHKLITEKSDDSDVDDINSYVVLADEENYPAEGGVEQGLGSIPGADHDVIEQKRKESVRRKDKGRTESRIKRKKSLKSRRDRQKSEDNDTDVFNDAVTDLDLDAFDTGMDTAFNTDNEQGGLSNESFEEITMGDKMKTSEHIYGENESVGGDFDFEIVMKPTMTDSQGESDFSLDISEDESVTVVMGFDKKLNLLTAVPPSLPLPKHRSGYSSEIEEDQEEGDLRPRRKKSDRVNRQARAEKGQGDSLPLWQKQLQIPAADVEVGVKSTSETDSSVSMQVTQTNNNSSEEHASSQILEYEVDWEVPIDDHASDKVIVDPESNVIRIGLRKGIIKGSCVRDRGSQENDDGLGLINITLKTDDYGKVVKGSKSVEEMPVVFMESMEKPEESTIHEEPLQRRRIRDRDGNYEGNVDSSESISEGSWKQSDAEKIDEKTKHDDKEEAISRERLWERRSRGKKNYPAEDTEEESSSREMLTERRARRMKDDEGQELGDEANSRKSFRERRRHEKEDDLEKEQIKEVDSRKIQRKEAEEIADGIEHKAQEENSSRKRLMERKTGESEGETKEEAVEEASQLKSLRRERRDEKNANLDQDVLEEISGTQLEATDTFSTRQDLRERRVHDNDPGKEQIIKEEDRKGETFRGRRRRVRNNDLEANEKEELGHAESLTRKPKQKNQEVEEEAGPIQSLRERRARNRKDEVTEADGEDPELKESLVGKPEEKKDEKQQEDEEKASPIQGLRERRARKRNDDRTGDGEEDEKKQETQEDDEKEEKAHPRRSFKERGAEGDLIAPRAEDTSGLNDSRGQRRSRETKENSSSNERLEKMQEREEDKNEILMSLKDAVSRESLQTGRMHVQDEVQREEEKSETEPEEKIGGGKGGEIKGSDKEVAKEGPVEEANARRSLRDRKTKREADHAEQEISGSIPKEGRAHEKQTDKALDCKGSSYADKSGQDVQRGANRSERSNKNEEFTHNVEQENLTEKENESLLNEEPEDILHGLSKPNVEAEKEQSDLRSKEQGLALDIDPESTTSLEKVKNLELDEKNSEILAIAETMLRKNLPVEHKPESSEWLENIRLKETGFIDKEIIGKSSIHEKITMENAFDERLLADAEALKYWDRVLEIKRMRRLSFQKYKELAGISKDVSDGKAEVIEERITGANEDKTENTGIVTADGIKEDESITAGKETAEEGGSNLSLSQQEMKAQELDFQQEIERMQTRAVDKKIEKEDGIDKVNSKEKVKRDASCESTGSLSDESIRHSCEDLTGKEERPPHLKRKRRGKGKAEQNRQIDSNNTKTKKVPLIQITEPSTEAFFESQDLEIDEDDEKFIEEVLKQLEQRKLERKKQRELEELEEQKTQSRKKTFYDDDDDLDMLINDVTSETEGAVGFDDESVLGNRNARDRKTSHESNDSEDVNLQMTYENEKEETASYSSPGDHCDDQAIKGDSMALEEDIGIRADTLQQDDEGWFDRKGRMRRRTSDDDKDEPQQPEENRKYTRRERRNIQETSEDESSNAEKVDDGTSKEENFQERSRIRRRKGTLGETEKENKTVEETSLPRRRNRRQSEDANEKNNVNAPSDNENVTGLRSNRLQSQEQVLEKDSSKDDMPSKGTENKTSRRSRKREEHDIERENQSEETEDKENQSQNEMLSKDDENNTSRRRRRREEHDVEKKNQSEETEDKENQSQNEILSKDDENNTSRRRRRREEHDVEKENQSEETEDKENQSQNEMLSKDDENDTSRRRRRREEHDVEKENQSEETEDKENQSHNEMLSKDDENDTSSRRRRREKPSKEVEEQSEKNADNASKSRRLRNRRKLSLESEEKDDVLSIEASKEKEANTAEKETTTRRSRRLHDDTGKDEKENQNITDERSFRRRRKLTDDENLSLQDTDKESFSDLNSRNDLRNESESETSRESQRQDASRRERRRRDDAIGDGNQNIEVEKEKRTIDKHKGGENGEASAPRRNIEEIEEGNMEEEATNEPRSDRRRRRRREKEEQETDESIVTGDEINGKQERRRGRGRERRDVEGEGRYKEEDNKRNRKTREKSEEMAEDRSRVRGSRMDRGSDEEGRNARRKEDKEVMQENMIEKETAPVDREINRERQQKRQRKKQEDNDDDAASKREGSRRRRNVTDEIDDDRFSETQKEDEKVKSDVSQARRKELPQSEEIAMEDEAKEEEENSRNDKNRRERRNRKQIDEETDKNEQVNEETVSQRPNTKVKGKKSNERGRRRRKQNEDDNDNEDDSDTFRSARTRSKMEQKRNLSEDEEAAELNEAEVRSITKLDDKERGAKKNDENERQQSSADEKERLQHTEATRKMRKSEMRRNSSVSEEDNHRQYHRSKERQNVFDKDKQRDSQDYDQEMVGSPRSPSSRHMWKGGSDTRSEASRSEAERSEAESESFIKVQDFTDSEKLDDEDSEMLGRRRRSSCRDVWKSGGEKSETESEGRPAFKRGPRAERSHQKAKDTKKEENDVKLENGQLSRPDGELRVPGNKARYKHGSKESLDQMIGVVRSPSTRDEWKQIQEECV